MGFTAAVNRQRVTCRTRKELSLQYKAVRGFKDILPDQMGAWKKLEEEAKRVFGLYGYRELRIPVLESTELFARGIGEETDIVSKEMYTFQDRKGNHVAMRPEATASILRAFIEHKLYAESFVHKVYTMGPMFRYERPQKGRRRQFHQIDVEIIGDPGPRSDSELISMLMQLFSSLGLNDLELHINSLGCLHDRGPFRAKLKDYLKDYTSQLCPDCRERMETNPLRVFDCKVERCIEIMNDAPTMLNFLCDECAGHFNSLKRYLDQLGLAYVVNSHLMRGLDYYTRTTFEVQTRELGAQSAIAGGGRYDYLMMDFGGPDTPAIGFAIGEERVVELLEEHAGLNEPGPDIFLAVLGKKAEDTAFAWMHELRKRGLWCEMQYQSSGLKAQMRHADRLNAKRVLIVGDDELAKGMGIIRDMATKEQMEVSLGSVVDEVVAMKERS
jgi:histidyl-tRNA synthetase